MSYFTAQELHAAAQTSTVSYIYKPVRAEPDAYSARGWVASSIPLTPSFTIEQAEEVVEAMRISTREGYHPKINRPWTIVNLHDNLDPSQTWLGFEYETGFNGGLETHQQVMDYLWNSFQYVAVDGEGCGDYPCEITMPPQALSDYESGTSYLQRLLKFMSENNITQEGEYSGVGTHCNVSTPTLRNYIALNEGSPVPHRDNYAVAQRLLTRINNCLSELPGSIKHELFGREPYGYGFMRYSGSSVWVEWKLFLSTDNISRVEGYITVGKNLGRMLDLGLTDSVEFDRLMSYINPTTIRDFLTAN